MWCSRHYSLTVVSRWRTFPYSDYSASFTYWEWVLFHGITLFYGKFIYIDFRYKIWHYSGTLLHEKLWAQGEELYDLCWKPEEEGKFKDPVITGQKVEGITTVQPQASKQVYRPPGARGKPVVNFNLHDEEIQPEKSKVFSI